MIKKSGYFMWILAAAGGIVLAMSYINPYAGTISLAELIFQLSGSRGELAMGFSINELLGYAMRLFPAWLFEAYMGIELYRHFCTASIYVFSRCEKRGRWYWKKMLRLLIDTLIFQCILTFSSVVLTYIRYDILFDVEGWKRLGTHILLYTFWTYTITVFMNVLAIKFGSDFGFMVAIGIQIVGIVAFLFGKNNRLFLEINMMSRLVLGWKFDRGISILLTGGLCVVVVVIGMVVVCRHDLLIADSEAGGM